jgi:lysophospholipase
MQLYALEGNPVPEGAVVGTVVTPDGVKLRYARWRSTARRSQGTVCLLLGRAEAIEKYFETIGDLRRRGFTVATFDWRGQGGSDRRLGNPLKAHVDSYGEYDRDLEAFTQQVMLPDCPPPHFALAHSMGGLVALRAARDNRARFTRMVLVAPLIAFGPTRPRQPVACQIAAMMTAIGLGEINAGGQAKDTIGRMPFSGNRLTRDHRRYERSRAIALKLPEVSVEGPTYGWIYATCRASREAMAPDFARGIKVPTLIVIGALDRVVSVAAVERLASEIRGGAQVVIAGAEHELLVERDPIREQFFAAFDAFIPGS